MTRQRYYEDGEIASWKDVLYYFYFQMKMKAISVLAHLTSFLLLSYVFLVGLVLFGISTQVLGGCNSTILVGKSSNPVTAVMAGVLVTSLFQSSMISNICFGTLAIYSGIDVKTAFYLTMGANVGNSVTSSIVAISHIRDKSLLERAVAGSSVNTIYSFLTISIFLPLEILSGVLLRLGNAIAPDSSSLNYAWRGLVGLIVHPVTDFLIIPNQSYLQGLMADPTVSCNSAYPVTCVEDNATFETCTAGFIACNSANGRCPVFFHDGATMQKDMQYAALSMSIAIAAMLISLFGMVKLVNKSLINTPIEVIAKLSTHNNYALMLMGCGSSILLSSSSVTECAVMPLVATGILELEQMFPWCLGSNMGVAISNMFLAWSTGSNVYLQVAIANVFFNLFGTMIWYPFPYLREFPLHAALVVGIVTRYWRFVSIIYFAITFIVGPLLVLGLGNLIYSKKKISLVMGWTLITILLLLVSSGIYRWFFNGGREKFIAFFEEGSDDEQIDEDVSVDDSSFYDYDTDDRSDVSSIGFDEARAAKSQRRMKTFANVRPKAASPPVARKRLIKNAELNMDENCCCTDQNFLNA